MATCTQVRKRISLWSDGRLDEAGQAAVRAHLDACPQCRQYRESLLAASDLLSSLERVQPRPGGWERLRERLSGPQPLPARGFVWPWRSLGAAAAAACAVALCALLLTERPSRQAVAPRAPAPAAGTLKGGAPSAAQQPQAHPPRTASMQAPQAAGERLALSPGAPGRSPGAYSRPPRRSGPPVAAARTGAGAAAPVRPQAFPPEPDPESLTASAFTPDAPAEAAETAEMVSAGLEPLMAAAATMSGAEDPLYWMSDVDPEEWL